MGQRFARYFRGTASIEYPTNTTKRTNRMRFFNEMLVSVYRSIDELPLFGEIVHMEMNQCERVVEHDRVVW